MSNGRPINFQTLPSQAPNTLPTPGVYMCEIKNAQIKTATNTYLELQLELSKGDGRKVATIYDRLFDIEADLPRFKLRQFITALKLPIVGDFTLSDLQKMVIGKKLLADIDIEKSKNPNYQDKAVVNPFKADIYYHIERAAELLGIAAPASAVTGAAPATNIDYLSRIDEAQENSEY